MLARLTIEEDRFGLEPEIVAKLARMKLDGGRPVRTAEVPVTYAGRGYAEGKKIGWRDGFAALWCIAKYSLREEACSTEAQETTEQTGRIGVEVVYVPLLREGTPVVRPTQAVPLGDGRFRVLATLNYDPDDETWEFPPGSIVRCRKETWSGNEVLVARERLVGP